MTGDKISVRTLLLLVACSAASANHCPLITMSERNAPVVTVREGERATFTCLRQCGSDAIWKVKVPHMNYTAETVNNSNPSLMGGTLPVGLTYPTAGDAPCTNAGFSYREYSLVIGNASTLLHGSVIMCGLNLGIISDAAAGIVPHTAFYGDVFVLLVLRYELSTTSTASGQDTDSQTPTNSMQLDSSIRQTATPDSTGPPPVQETEASSPRLVGILAAAIVVLLAILLLLIVVGLSMCNKTYRVWQKHSKNKGASQRTQEECIGKLDVHDMY